jgi:hypothetical protein
MSDNSNLPVADSGSLIDAFATELLRVERLGSCARLVFAVPRQSGSSAYRETIAAVVVPVSALQDMAKKLVLGPRESVTDQPETVLESEELHWQRPH